MQLWNPSTLISTFLLHSLYTVKKMKKRRYKSTKDPQDTKANEMKRIFFFFFERVIKLYWLAQSQNTCSFTVTLSQTHQIGSVWYDRRGKAMCHFLYSFFLFHGLSFCQSPYPTLPHLDSLHLAAHVGLVWPLPSDDLE